jgi:hypothetical protein
MLIPIANEEFKKLVKKGEMTSLSVLLSTVNTQQSVSRNTGGSEEFKALKSPSAVTTSNRNKSFYENERENEIYKSVYMY